MILELLINRFNRNLNSFTSPFYISLLTVGVQPICAYLNYFTRYLLLLTIPPTQVSGNSTAKT